MTDPEALFMAHNYVRLAYLQVARLAQRDATVRDVATQLDEMASYLQTDLDAAQHSQARYAALLAEQRSRTAEELGAELARLTEALRKECRR